MTDAHLTDEQLSSHLDAASGAGRDEKAAASIEEHLAVCAPCRQRLAALGAVRQVLRRPLPPVDRDVRSASIASVMAAVGEDSSGVDASAGSGVDGRPAPIAITRRRPQVLVGAAAAVLVLAAAIGVPLALAGKSASQSTASAPAAGASSGRDETHQGNRASGTEGISANAADTVSNLGKVGSPEALRVRVAQILPGASAAAPTKNAATSSPSSPTSTTGTGTGTGSSGSKVPGPFSVQRGLGTPGQFERCLSSATRAVGPARTVQLLATATYSGTPALVYVFGPSSSGSASGNAARSAVVATARDGCRILATTYL
jgi:hypothetical protein